MPTFGVNRKLKERSRNALQEYHRRLKLAAFFEHHKEKEIVPFIDKSEWTPNDQQLPSQVTQIIKKDIRFFDSSFHVSPLKPNLTEGEIKALKALRNNSGIVIKPADKGSAVVIMDRDQYLLEGYRQLNNKEYYKKLEAPIIWETVPMVEEILQRMLDKKIINFKQKKYLTGSTSPRSRLFYLLPKIHKGPETWTIPFLTPAGRPIVSDCDSETYRTAEFLDRILFPLSTKHSSYIKDTYDFISKIKNINIPLQSFLFSMDVTSLYTNIEINEGIQAVKKMFLKYPDSSRPEKEILELLTINLCRNDFQFNGECFLQVKGTAMGKKFAPAYANIFMADWEEKALEKCSRKPLIYLRYLDDIWGIWTYSRDLFQEFVNTLNAQNSSIQLTAVLHTEKIDFLDTTVFKGKEFKRTGILDVKVFFKETDTHALLHFNSHHPKHTFAGIVKSQLLRFNRICTTKEHFFAATKTLFAALLKRGYYRSFLRNCYRHFTEVKPIRVEEVLPLVVFYSHPAQRLARKTREHFTSTLKGTNILNQHRFMAAYRRNPNLSNFLVRAKIDPDEVQKTTKRTSDDFYRHRTWVSNQSSKDVFKTQDRTDARTKNVVYLITCKVCKKQYVGETKNNLLTRFTQHRYNIKNEKNMNTALVFHFVAHGWENISATILESNPRWTEQDRRRRESVWIARLRTKLPYGLNERGGLELRQMARAQLAGGLRPPSRS